MSESAKKLFEDFFGIETRQARKAWQQNKSLDHHLPGLTLEDPACIIQEMTKEANDNGLPAMFVEFNNQHTEASLEWFENLAKTAAAQEVPVHAERCAA